MDEQLNYMISPSTINIKYLHEYLINNIPFIKVIELYRLLRDDINDKELINYLEKQGYIEW